MKIFRLVRLALLSALLLSLAAHAEPWEVNMRNDFVMPAGKDRFLSNAFYFKRGQYKIGNDMYTPKNKRSTEIDTGDHPWDGYTYLEREDVDTLAFGQEMVLRSRLGLVGENSGSEALQKFVHEDLGLGVPPSWIGQNSSEYTVDAIASKRVREYVQSILGDTQLQEEYGIRFGNVNNSLFLDQQIRKHFGRYLYLYAGLRGDVVAYNTHLDGRMFRNNLYTVDKNWFVATGRIGFELYFSTWHHMFLNYGYEYVTEEFKDQEGRHSYGTLTFGQKF